MKKLFFLLFFSVPLFAQVLEKPLQRKEMDSLKKNEPTLWYADSIPPSKAKKQSIKKDSTAKAKIDERVEDPTPLEISETIAKLIKWAVYIFIFLAVLFLILKGNLSFKLKPSDKGADGIIDEKTQIESIDQLKKVGFEEQIKKAELDENFRLAIRLYYLWLIKKLSDSQLIQFHIKKTNEEYCRELAKSKLFEDFKQCTLFYNYVWFGEFRIKEPDYQEIKNSFIKLLSKI